MGAFFIFITFATFPGRSIRLEEAFKLKRVRSAIRKKVGFRFVARLTGNRIGPDIKLQAERSDLSDPDNFLVQHSARDQLRLPSILSHTVI
jgi:hypothetical protein